MWSVMAFTWRLRYDLVRDSGCFGLDYAAVKGGKDKRLLALRLKVVNERAGKACFF
jgi:hypothetical protein